MNDFQYLADRLGTRAGKATRRPLHLLRRRPRLLDDYVKSVQSQTITGQQPTAAHLAEAFGDLLLSQRVLDRLGTGGQFRAGTVSVRGAGKWQD